MTSSLGRRLHGNGRRMLRMTVARRNRAVVEQKQLVAIDRPVDVVSVSVPADRHVTTMSK